MELPRLRCWEVPVAGDTDLAAARAWRCHLKCVYQRSFSSYCHWPSRLDWGETNLFPIKIDEKQIFFFFFRNQNNAFPPALIPRLNFSPSLLTLLPPIPEWCRRMGSMLSLLQPLCSSFLLKPFPCSSVGSSMGCSPLGGTCSSMGFIL